MTSKSKKKSRMSGWKIPILPVIGVVTSFNDRLSIAQSALTHLPHGNITDFGADLAVQVLGIDPRDKGFRIPTLTVSLVAEKTLNKVLKGVFKGLPLKW